MIRSFHFRKEIKTKRSIYVQTEATIPLEIMVAIGKRHAVGIAELGNQYATIEKSVIPFMKPPEPEELAKELLNKLKIPENEWEEILRTRKEMVI